MKTIISHITTAHTATDVRIFHKECMSLTKVYDVELIISNDTLVSTDSSSINVVTALYKKSNRLLNFFTSGRAAYSAAKASSADVFHFHDPNFLPWAALLNRRGKKVVYDVHEDVPRQILGKLWIPKFIRKVLSSFFEQYENNVSTKFEAIVAATPFIRERFKKINFNTIDVNNYPILYKSESKQLKGQSGYICYAGGITENRGLRSLVEAMSLMPKMNLKLAGRYDPESFRSELEKVQGWEQVEELGYIDREEIRGLIKGSVAGLVTLKALPNYLDSLPIKMFEYMLEGVPVIASNFPYWKTIIEENDCGVCVDPESAEEIAKAVKLFHENLPLRDRMGANGRRLVLEKYNWDNEEKKLLKLYKEILS